MMQGMPSLAVFLGIAAWRVAVRFPSQTLSDEGQNLSEEAVRHQEQQSFGFSLKRQKVKLLTRMLRN